MYSMNSLKEIPVTHLWPLAWVLLISGVAGCQKQPTTKESHPAGSQTSSSSTHESSRPEKPVSLQLEKLERPGIHNLYRVTDWLYSGSSPEIPVGLKSLQDLGVKTIISVDGMRPDVTAARNRGLRYVHIPVGYDGIPQETAWRLAKAAHDLPRPIYVHCHHGKHRGPTAAAQILQCNDSQCTVSDALAILRTLGTDPKYRGLYGSVESLMRPSSSQFETIADDFPETAPVPQLAEIMVQLDLQWDQLKQKQSLKWAGTEREDPKLRATPAVLLGEHYREAARLPDSQTRPEPFRQLLQSATQEAAELERLLVRSDDDSTSNGGLEAAFNKSAQLCSKCHSQFRDLPRN
ncbi:MAG: hypothetical protein JWM11_818 [Planctomycetaceae bacterium]|nr:hypothetical protein [Planctomycetaceae bacterium]